MANEVIGECVCPLCREPGAEVRKGLKGPYIVCLGCMTQCRTMSRAGYLLIQSLLPKREPPADPEPAAPAAPAPKPAPAPAPAPKPQKKAGSWFSPPVL